MALFWNFAARLHSQSCRGTAHTRRVAGMETSGARRGRAVPDTAGRAHQPFVLRLLIDSKDCVAFLFILLQANSRVPGGDWPQICVRSGGSKGRHGKERRQPSVEGRVGVCEIVEEEWGEGILGGGAGVCSHAEDDSPAGWVDSSTGPVGRRGVGSGEAWNSGSSSVLQWAPFQAGQAQPWTVSRV